MNIHFLPSPSRKVLTQSNLKLWVLRKLGQFSRALRCQQKSVPFDGAKYNGKLKNKNTSKEESKIRMKSLFQISTSNSKEIQVTSSKQESAL